MHKATGTPLASLFRETVVLRIGALLALLILAAVPALAQHQVTGEVTDADDGESLPGVNIVVKDGGIWYAETAAYGPVTEVGHAF